MNKSQISWIELRDFIRSLMYHLNRFPEDKICVDYVKDCIIDEYLRLLE